MNISDPGLFDGLLFLPSLLRNNFGERAVGKGNITGVFDVHQQM